MSFWSLNSDFKRKLSSPAAALTAAGLSALTLGACGMFGGGSVIDNEAQIVATDLALLEAEGGLRSVRSSLNLATGECDAAETSCTPTGLSGRVYAAGAMLGTGDDSYSMTFMADSDEVIEDPSQGSGGTLDFDVLVDDPVSGKASIPGESDMPENAVVTDIEFKFDYLDATFTLTGTSGGTADGTYTVRTVFVSEATADDVTGTMQRGDLLIRADGETAFKWCSATECTATRPQTPHQFADLAAWEPSPQGGEFYTPVSFDIAEADRKTFTHAELADTSKVWKVDLAVTNAVRWSAAPSTFASEEDIVENFMIHYNEGATGDDSEASLTATFEIVDP